MDKRYYFSPNLLTEVEHPNNGMVSRTLFNDEDTKIILFAFAQGHELAAHSAPMPATIQILSGEATVTVEDDALEVSPGSLLHMRPQLVHSVTARSPVKMLLTLHKSSRHNPGIQAG